MPGAQNTLSAVVESVAEFACRQEAGTGDRAWSYRRARPDALGEGANFEIAVWRGDVCPPLHCHFHDEVQISFVLSGSHRFRIGADSVVATAGECLLIPAGMPHAPVPHDQPGSWVANAYVAEETFIRANRHVRRFDMRRDGARGFDDVLQIGSQRAARHDDAVLQQAPDQRLLDLLLSGVDIAALARHTGYSREEFTRRFVKRVGMPPHAHRLIHRLNRARALLRSGEPVAMVAAETGFSDQSHLGRHFRRVFGTSPGAYRGAGF
jgi:AraC-like DNA-binding protein/mannose-6-phosphate isomerase-like protein (cupin superfamily)